VKRIAARLAVIVLFLGAGCGGGGGDSSDVKHRGVEAFPDVVEIARAELGEDAALAEATVSETAISFVHVQLGRNVRVVYNTNVVFVGNERVRKKLNPAATFPISSVASDAPARLLAAIQAREGKDVTGFTATLARNSSGALAWRAKAAVEGSPKTYDADADGTLRG
jgi:hypothetical protein